MKTQSYNPSHLEIEMTQIIHELQENISKKFRDNEIITISSDTEKDNPIVRIQLLDKDGDPHELVLKIIQTPDKF
jgi:hypothetical protein